MQEYLIHTHIHRGLSSTVRRCVARDTGQEFAVKIIDKSQDEAISESIAAEIQVLSVLPKHKYISESWKKAAPHCGDAHDIMVFISGKSVVGYIVLSRLDKLYYPWR